MKLSFRDRTSTYLGQSPNVPQGLPYTSKPDAPWDSQEMGAYTGLPQNQYFCPDCKTLNLFINIKDNQGDCDKCQGRFSLKDAQQGNAYNNRLIPRETGLLDMTDGSNSMPEAHTSPIAPGAPSSMWGSGKS